MSFTFFDLNLISRPETVYSTDAPVAVDKETKQSKSLSSSDERTKDVVRKFMAEDYLQHYLFEKTLVQDNDVSNR